MEIILLSNNKKMCDSWNKYFGETDNVKIICTKLEEYDEIDKCDCVVSPANSYGIMDGGFDLAITNIYGSSLMKRVQGYIIENYNGEQPVGTSFIIDINNNQKLIHTPTMRYPGRIKDDEIVYQAMRTTLLCAKENNIKRIIIPAFGSECGDVDYDLVAKMMKAAYVQLKTKPKEINWDTVEN